ncbi:uncharacterized protein LOC144301747 isoform X3 [Canis aureus]
MKSPPLASEGLGDTTRELWEEGCGAQTPSPGPSEISGDETLSEQHKLETRKRKKTPGSCCTSHRRVGLTGRPPSLPASGRRPGQSGAERRRFLLKHTKEVVLSARELGYVKRYSIIGNAECFPESILHGGSAVNDREEFCVFNKGEFQSLKEKDCTSNYCYQS